MDQQDMTSRNKLRARDGHGPIAHQAHLDRIAGKDFQGTSKHREGKRGGRPTKMELDPAMDPAYRQPAVGKGSPAADPTLTAALQIAEESILHAMQLQDEMQAQRSPGMRRQLQQQAINAIEGAAAAILTIAYPHARPASIRALVGCGLDAGFLLGQPRAHARPLYSLLKRHAGPILENPERVVDASMTPVLDGIRAAAQAPETTKFRSKSR